jgi:hypothetical protein
MEPEELRQPDTDLPQDSLSTRVPSSTRVRQEARAFLHVPSAVLLLGYSTSASDVVIDPHFIENPLLKTPGSAPGFFLPDWRTQGRDRCTDSFAFAL